MAVVMAPKAHVDGFSTRNVSLSSLMYSSPSKIVMISCNEWDILVKLEGDAEERWSREREGTVVFC